MGRLSVYEVLLPFTNSHLSECDRLTIVIIDFGFECRHVGSFNVLIIHLPPFDEVSESKEECQGRME